MLAATAAWAIGEALMRRSTPLDHVARASWTLGITLALVHVALAFQLVYAWDHDAAVAATAQQTGDLTGWRWRGGIFVNYVFLAMWLADTCWWWIAPQARAARSKSLELARLAFFMFMFVNGAVVFASGIGRIVGMMSVALVVAAALTRRREMVRA